MKSLKLTFLVGCVAVVSSFAASASTELLVQVDPARQADFVRKLATRSERAEILGVSGWILVQSDSARSQSRWKQELSRMAGVRHVQPNYRLGIRRTLSLPYESDSVRTVRATRVDPAVPPISSAPNGSNDAQTAKQWGMADIGALAGQAMAPASSDIVVAVIDTGVDYTHEDLNANIWRNPGEIAGNGIDDDGNGYVDDIVGWDFAANDNLPYDTHSANVQEIMQGANPGHGTHCAGNVGAVAKNGKGIFGVAPNIKMMVMRFLTEKGEGTTANAVKSVKYAVDNGARVLSNSWGSVGEDPNEASDNQALKDTIQYAADRNVLFVAAAGNGNPQTGQGYDNDSSSTPAYPASYAMENIVSVAALDSAGALGKFSNWGARSVDIGAPGVKVFSTVPAGRYQDVVVEIFGFPLATWDGTSMATPHVAGAAGLYLSKHPNASWREVKEALLRSAKPTASLNGKSVSGGRLDVEALMRN